jgi:hypothetical protein
MGIKQWSMPWRLHSKGLEATDITLSTKDKVISWTILTVSILLVHFLMHLAF